jgi:hypothetical protein
MALIKGKLIDPSTAIKQSSDPVSTEDLARKGYVDSKASAEADAAELAAKAYADQKVADLVNSAPAVLDTLKELSDALGGDENFASTVSGQIGAVDDRVDQEILDRQSAISTEQAARQLADQGLQSNIDSEESRAMGEESRIEGKVDQEISDRQAAVSSEASARQSADSVLDGKITTEKNRAEGEEERIEGKVDQEILDRQSAVSSEQSRAQGEEQRIEGKVDQEVIDRQAAVLAEQTARQSADSALDGRLDVLEADPTTKTYVDGKFSDAEAYTDQKVADLVNGAPAMLDTLKELADAIESQGGSLSESILTQVGQVDDKIDQEIADRQAADLVLDGKITTEKNRAEGEEARIEGKVDQEVLDRQSAVSSEASARQTADTNLQNQIDDLVSDLAAETQARESADQDYDNALTSEISRAQSAEQTLQNNINSEASSRQSADQTLQSNINTVSSDLSSEVTRAMAAESSLDARIDVLEAAPSPKGRKEVKTMSASDISNAYVDMAEEAMPNTMMVSVSGTVQYEGEDYTLSTVNNKTRVTFIGDLTPDGNGAALVEGEKVYCQYLVMSTSEQQVSGGGGSSSGGSSSGTINGVYWEALGGGNTEWLSGVADVTTYVASNGTESWQVSFTGSFTVPPFELYGRSDSDNDGSWEDEIFDLLPGVTYIRRPKAHPLKTYFVRVKNTEAAAGQEYSQVIKIVIP